MKRVLLILLLLCTQSLHALEKESVKAISNRILELFSSDVDTFHQIHEGKLYRHQTPYHLHVDLDLVWEGKGLYAATFVHGGIYMTGEWFRQKLIGEFGAVYVLCHELGHQFGGAPFGKFEKNEGWISTEGQSDYFASAVCLKRYFKTYQKSYEKLETEAEVSVYHQQLCQKVYPNSKEAKFCSVMLSETEKVFHAFTKIRKKNEKLSPLLGQAVDHPRETGDHYNRHPAPQCRYETVVKGFLCNNDYTNYNLWDSYQVEQYCQAKTDGARPSCWFNDQVPYPVVDPYRLFDFPKPKVIDESVFL